MMPSDLLGWVGEQAREGVSHFRLIRTGKANRYMVLMKFRDAKTAKVWRKEYNSRVFNSMEPEYCHVVFVQSITFETGDGTQQPSSFPNMNDDPFLPKTQPTTKTSTSASTEVSLEKWRGSGCPVCRYTQNSGIPGVIRTANSADTENACSVCGSEQNLWICLICGNVGCGRYDSAHAFAHYEDTRHSYAMDITTQHVWDYVGDGYVHRLIQNKADGKMVDLPEAWNGGKSVNGGMAALGADMVPREKMDAMGNEYAYLLQSQLENQRSYFEDQLERAVEKASKASAAAEKAAAALDDMNNIFNALQTQHSEAQNTMQNLERDLERTTKKAEKTDALAKKLAKDWKEEKIINEGLMDKLRVLDENIKEGEQNRLQLEAEKKELEEQNRDLSFFITGGEKLQELREAGEDIDGQIEVPIGEQSGGKRRTGKGRR